MPFFPAVYSSLSSKALLQLVLDNYNLDPGSSITFLKRGFNDTYLISYSLVEEKLGSVNEDVNTKIIGTHQKHILRVYKHNWRNFESIETELKLLNYLKENDVSVSFPVIDKNAKYIQEIQAPEGLRYAVLFSFAEGRQIRKLSLDQSYLLGVETGRIHSLTRNKSFGITAQNYDIEKLFENALVVLKPLLKNHPEQYEYLRQLKNEFIDMFCCIDKKDLRTGICHGDLQAENFHITKGNRFTFFDFDFFGTGYLAYDIGVFMWYDHKNKTREIMDAFLKGYQTHEKLALTELKLIPYFSTLRALFQMALYCSISDGANLPLWPAEQVADFVGKIKKWHNSYELRIKTNYESQ